MPAGVLLTHPASLEHDTGAHPERAARLAAVENALSAARSLPYTRSLSPAVSREALLRAHPAAYVDAIERVCAAGGGALDPDTVASSGTWEAALHSCGGAVAVVDALLSGGARVGASLHRPPGHHAEAARAMGFCFFANAAVAARHALSAYGLSRVLILDWDVHHGNGTNDILHADPEVLFVSIHESPLYPGSGPASDAGSGRGLGFTVNVPVPAGSGDETWCSLVEHVVAPLALGYEPELVLVSAGFDAHADDPLAGCRVSDDGFASMAASVLRVARTLEVPVGLLLEGGYDLDALSRCVVRVLAVLGGDPPAAPGDALPVHPLAEAARGRLAERWPVFA